jgi:hypothetical protein
MNEGIINESDYECGNNLILRTKHKLELSDPQDLSSVMLKVLLSFLLIY